MQELALHVLDIAQNSIRAGASCIQIGIDEDYSKNVLQITIEDNGSGIDEAIKPHLTNPFTTTRTLRRVGLGLPFMAQMCEETDGKLIIESEKGKGTKVVAMMAHNHIDRLPIGAMHKTIGMLILAKPEIHYAYTHTVGDASFVFDTETIQGVLDGVPIQDLEIIKWIETYIEDRVKSLTLSIK
ncbi:MAG: ATP-binding protein [Cellulosilyticaceae bacterium]